MVLILAFMKKCFTNLSISKLFYIFSTIFSLQISSTMLSIQQETPIKETINKLAKFPRFSLIQKIEPKFFPTSAQASRVVAEQIRKVIQQKNAQGKTCVLGLATGSTPLRVYKELIKMHKQQGLSFKNVVTFNLDQYYPISHQNPESYHYYMKNNLFAHIDIPPENTNVPNGEIQRKDVTSFCENYEKKIKDYGGIDLQILGIGRTGHIGFNQPPSPSDSITRLVYLHRLTRKDAANAFGGIQYVPKCAITMGIATIRQAKKILIMAWSQNKAPIVKASIEGPKTNDNPSTFLHEHDDATFYLDQAAGEKLSRFTIPWTIKGDSEDPQVPRNRYWIIKSVLWLAESVNKPLLRLTHDDYEDKGLLPLVIDCAQGKVEDLNLFVYTEINNRITGWPLKQKPDFTESSQSFHKQKHFEQRILIFSPHPDDDVISMGSTIKKLVKKGHNVSIAYMTTGSNSVHDHQAEKFSFFLRDFNNQEVWKLKNEKKGQFFQLMSSKIKQALTCIDKKTETDRTDSKAMVMIKKLIRYSEAKIAAEHLGVKPSNLFYLNLPFYGQNNKKKSISEGDLEAVRNILDKIKPTFIYAAGDLTDPHATHRRCLEILLKVIQQRQKERSLGKTDVNIPPPHKIFFYRGAWEQWDIAQARQIVVMSPQDLQDKTDAIIKHQSQKHNPLYPGDDSRQFWLRSKERNKGTATYLNKLGFCDYEGLECFVNLTDFRNYAQI